MRICGRSDSDCIRNITNYIDTQSSVNTSLVCNCFPGCFDIKYETEVSVAPLLPNEELLSEGGLSAQNVSIMHVFYKTRYLRSQSKDEIIGFTEFLCKFGIGIEYYSWCVVLLFVLLFLFCFSQHGTCFPFFFFRLFFFFLFEKTNQFHCQLTGRHFGALPWFQRFLHSWSILLVNISPVHSTHKSVWKTSSNQKS